MIKLRNTVIPNRYDNRKNGILGALTKLGSAVSGLNPITSLVGAGISGVTSMIAGNKQVNAQKEINAQQLALQREQMQQQQAQFESQQAYQTMDWQRNRNAALEDWSKQRGAALEDFVRENQWNSPAAQRARYEAAGLNPALAMEGQSAAVGQMEATSAPSAASGSSPSPGGMPSLPNLGVPNYGFVKDALDSSIRTYQGMQQARLMEENIYQSQIDSSTKIAEKILELQNGIINLENSKVDNALKEQQLATMKHELKFWLETRDLVKRGLQWDNNNKIAQWSKINSDKKKVDTEERIMRIEEQFKPRLLEMGLRVSANQIAQGKQAISESAERIHQMILDGKVSRSNVLSQKNLADKQARKIVMEIFKLDPNSRESRLLRNEIRARIYDIMRIKAAGFGVPNPGFLMDAEDYDLGFE